MKLYHATAAEKLDSIRDSGLNPLSYWTTCEAIARYYLETVEDEKLSPVLLTINLSLLDKSALEPDYPGIEEPISTVLQLSEGDVMALWEQSPQDWRASLEVVRSLRYRARIPATMLQLELGASTKLLAEVN